MLKEQKTVNFFPEIADAFTGAKSYDKSDCPQKQEHSPEIKTNCYFWTSSNHSSYVFLTNNLILDILS